MYKYNFCPGKKTGLKNYDSKSNVIFLDVYNVNVYFFKEKKNHAAHNHRTPHTM